LETFPKVNKVWSHEKWNIKFEINIVTAWLVTLFYRWVCRSSGVFA